MRIIIHLCEHYYKLIKPQAISDVLIIYNLIYFLILLSFSTSKVEFMFFLIFRNLEASWSWLYIIKRYQTMSLSEELQPKNALIFS